ncbi:MAG: bacteriophage Gp15 family protein [Clostridium sp.]|nr:bacteriophage Gp15 family protein [Clostridium sp.]
MNILIDLVPESVEIDGIEYEIRTDFRISILFEMMMQDEELSNEEKILKALELYYPIIPDNVEEAIDKIKWFYRCGKDIVKSNNESHGESVKIYDYEYDDDYIYSAFLSQYNVDLQDIKHLHWWKFKAMFKSLNEDNKIVKIMQYRSIDLSEIKDKEQNAYYRKMKKLYEIPRSTGEVEKIRAIEDALMKGESIKHLL